MFYYQDMEATDMGKATQGLLQHVVFLLSRCAKEKKIADIFINWGLK